MATWEQVREEWSKAEQMGYQSVLQAAKVGEMLIELKAGFDDNKKFLQRAVKEVGFAQAHTYNLMTLARHLPLLEQHKPDSQRAALGIIKAQQPPKPHKPKATREPEQEEEMKPFDTGMVLVLTGISKSTSGSSLTAARKELEARFGKEAINHFTESEYWAAAKQLAAENKCAAKFKEADKIQEEIEKLSKQSQLQINKAVSAKTAMLEADFDRRVREAADAMIPDRVRIYEELQAKADIAQMRYLAMASGISAHIDQQEYRILRSFFHSDKTPTDQQKNEAFHIIQKIGEYVKATAQ